MKRNSVKPLSVYFCGKEQCAPGHFFGPAIRPHYLMHMILDGRGIFERQGVTYHLKKGDAFLISPLESTYYEADAINPWHYLWIGFDGEMVPSLLQETCFQNTCVFRCPDDPTIQSAVIRQSMDIFQSFQQVHSHPLKLNGMVLELLDLMQGSPSQEKDRYPLQYLQKAKEYMENNYSYHLEISDIARYIGIDRTYLYRIFMDEMKLSPKQYLFQLRIRNAVNMLRSPHYTITEIAYSCGFHDASAFCHYFKKVMKQTPGEFRKLSENQ
jgi:AraC-like DNA-binding protein